MGARFDNKRPHRPDKPVGMSVCGGIVPELWAVRDCTWNHAIAINAFCCEALGIASHQELHGCLCLSWFLIPAQMMISSSLAVALAAALIDITSFNAQGNGLGAHPGIAG